MDYSEKTGAYQTVAIFAGIVGKNLFLKHGTRSRNDGAMIVADLQGPNLYVEVEHQLSHVVFGSDGRAGALFVQDYSRLAAGHAQKHGYAIHGKKIRKVMREVIGILDTERCLGLWGRLYPGSEFEKRHCMYKATLPEVPQAHSDLMTLFYVIAAGHTAGPGTYEEFEPLFKQALTRVKGTDFRAVLITAKWLMTQMVDHMMDPDRNETDEDRAEAMDEVIEQSQGSGDPREDLLATEQSNWASREQKSRAKQDADEALRASVRDQEAFQQSLEGSKAGMTAVVDKVRSHMTKKPKRDELLRRNAKAKVVFRDITKADIGNRLVEISPEDREVIRRLRVLFYRTMGRRVRVLEDEGTEIDALAMIHRRITASDDPMFRVSVPGRGFKSLVLMDRSGSMQKRTKRAERACRILNKALKFPFVDSHTWGFQSTQSGQVDITRFDPGVEVFTTAKSKVDGNTPLHTAIHLGAQHLMEGSEYKQLFVVSDGEPHFFKRDGDQMSTRMLLDFVRNEVQFARRKGIQVTAVLLGERVGGVVQAEMDSASMEYMFGSRKSWRIMDEAGFDRDFVRLVSDSFLSFLRHR